MKLFTFRTPDLSTRAGVVYGERIITLDYPTVLELLRDPAGLAEARKTFERQGEEYINVSSSAGLLSATEPLFAMALPQHVNLGEEYMLNEVVLYAPIPEPPSVRDFYAFEQHVKAARAKRGVGMIPEWYEIPTFYFTNNSEI